MRLLACRRISDKGFREAVIKLSRLEELDIRPFDLYKYSLEVMAYLALF
jgi:hypothetical protein